MDDVDSFSVPDSDSDTSEVEIDSFFQKSTPKVADFVLVEFANKKSVKYFVGQITEIISASLEVMVNFLRKSQANFLFPTIRDEGVVLQETIKKFLPAPQIRRGHYNFKIPFPHIICIG